MKILFPLIFIASFVLGIYNKSAHLLTYSILSESQNAIELFITISAGMIFWSGIMNIVIKSGMCDIFGKILSPFTGLIFKGINKDEYAYKLIVMNITANLLGLGNASTPLGIKAVKELARVENSKGYATKNIAKLIILNTSSIQLFPVTVGTLRFKNGSESPFEILGCVFITSLLSVLAGILTVELFSHKKG